MSSRSQCWKVYVIMTSAVRSFHRPRNWLAINYTLEYIHTTYMHLISLVENKLKLIFEEKHIINIKMNTLKPNQISYRIGLYIKFTWKDQANQTSAKCARYWNGSRPRHIYPKILHLLTDQLLMKLSNTTAANGTTSYVGNFQ